MDPLGWRDERAVGAFAGEHFVENDPEGVDVGAVIGGGITLYLAVTRPDVLIRKDCVRDGATMVCGKDEARPAQ